MNQMKDNHDATAAGFMAQYGYTDTYARDDLADLLRANAGTARNEAIEEAAKVAEGSPLFRLPLPRRLVSGGTSSPCSR